MRHRVNGRKFNRRTEQRQALLNSLARALLRYEQIKTTLPKAKELRPYVEKLISLGKDSSLANRRRLFAKCRDNSLVAKVFGTLAQRYNSRNGGYTRIVKAGFREGDCAPMAIIELVDRDVNAKGAKDLARVAAEKAAAAAAEAAAEAPVEEAPKAEKKAKKSKKEDAE